ncbi:hypothetical protein V2J52_02030 [Georgenia sp. MJ173]|uniref:hypothetical protein n=1 Tax=Georgenia sunbinii TaxID=3117728 RepID=UPI002F26A64C
MTLTLLQLRVMFDGPLISLLAVLLFGALVRHRSRPEVGRSVRGWTLTAALLAVVAVVIERLSWVLPTPFADSTTQTLVSLAAPLGAGIVAVVLLVLPAVRHDATGSADLSPRTLTSFTAPGLLVALPALAITVLVVSVLAGQASIPDDQGRYRSYEIEIGNGVVAGADIYGWYYSLPSMVLLALLLVATLIAVKAVARPALNEQLADVATRRWRTRNILAMSLGAMLVHLASILQHLVGTARLTAGLPTDQGWISARPPLIILETPMRLTATVAELGGWFLWFAILLVAVLPATHMKSKAPWQSVSR